MRRRRGLLALLIVVAIGLAVGGAVGAYHHYAYVWRKTHEPQTDATETSTNPVYTDDEFRDTLEAYGFDRYFDLDQVVADSYVLPGLYSTRTMEDNKDLATCTSMVPQGVCVAGRYVLVSAYCASKTHNSVVYAIDGESHDLVKVVVLKDRPHVGGITYDPDSRNVWICGYDEESKTAYANVIALDAVDAYDLGTSQAPCDYTAQYPLYSMDHASFMDYFDQAIYIGTYVNGKDNTSTVQQFWLKGDGTPYTLDDYGADFLDQNDDSGLADDERSELEDYLGADDGDASRPDLDGNTIVPVDASLIDGEIQGFTIDADFAATSQSSGPANSTVYLFQNTGTLSDVLRTADNAVATYTMPPMLEEIATDEGGRDGGKAYLCFESGAYAYRARWNAKIDRIVVLAEGPGE